MALHIYHDTLYVIHEHDPADQQYNRRQIYIIDTPDIVVAVSYSAGDTHIPGVVQAVADAHKDNTWKLKYTLEQLVKFGDMCIAALFHTTASRKGHLINHVFTPDGADVPTGHLPYHSNSYLTDCKFQSSDAENWGWKNKELFGVVNNLYGDHEKVFDGLIQAGLIHSYTKFELVQREAYNFTRAVEDGLPAYYSDY